MCRSCGGIIVPNPAQPEAKMLIAPKQQRRLRRELFAAPECDLLSHSGLRLVLPRRY
jgi:hypothetical protein